MIFSQQVKFFFIYANITRFPKYLSPFSLGFLVTLTYLKLQTSDRRNFCTMIPNMQLNHGKFECNAMQISVDIDIRRNLIFSPIKLLIFWMRYADIPLFDKHQFITYIPHLEWTRPPLSKRTCRKAILASLAQFPHPSSATLSCIYTRHEKFPLETLPTNFKCSGDGGASQSWPASRQIAAMHPETRRFREVARKQVAPMSLKRSIENPSLPIIPPSFLPSFLNSTLNYRRFYFHDYEPLWFQRIAYLSVGG